ncbi:MAG TPA: hypothetical protein VM345_18385 [Acidimicrobiales bacterium]|nr:hypothetical protein [Acidimicrobiales bacterium]
MTSNDPYRKHDDKAEDPGHHAGGAGAPGASGPGEPGYDGEATIGDDGGATGTESAGADTTREQDHQMAAVADRAIRKNIDD